MTRTTDFNYMCSSKINTQLLLPVFFQLSFHWLQFCGLYAGMTFASYSGLPELPERLLAYHWRVSPIMKIETLFLRS